MQESGSTSPEPAHRTAWVILTLRKEGGEGREGREGGKGGGGVEGRKAEERRMGEGEEEMGGGKGKRTEGRTERWRGMRTGG